MSGDPIKQDNPLMAVSRGDFFIPQEQTWSSKQIKWLWIAIDVTIAVGFVIAAILLAV